MKKLWMLCIVTLVLLQAEPLWPATLEVRPPGGVGALGDVFTSIQQAIDAAGNGDTITVHPGIYDEALNIEGFTGLTLTGTDKTTVIIKSSVTLPWNVGGYGTSRQTVVRVVNSTAVVLANMTMDFDLIKGNSRFGVTGWDSSVTIDNCILKNMSVDDLSGGYTELGTYFRAPGYTDAARATITITNNEFINAGRVGVVTHDYINADISGNTFYKTLDDFGYAVEVGSQSTGSVTGNTIYGYDTPAASDGSESAGIYVENCFTGGSPSVTKNVTVSGNEIYDCQYAMWIGNGYDGYSGDVDIVIAVSGNNFHDNVDGAVILQDEDAEAGSSVTAAFQNNTVTDNNSYGYHIFTQGDGSITANFTGETITAHDTAIAVDDFGAASSSSYSIQVRNSNLSGNSSYGINNTVSTVVVDAIQNCWGDATGPYHPVTNPGGLGSSVSDNVDYYPWYLDCTLTTPVYKPVHNVILDAYYDNIKLAVIAAGSGDLITVDPGTYVENGQIVIDKDLTIKGLGGKPVVQTDQDTGTSENPRGWWLVNAGISLELENMVLDGSGHLIYQAIRNKGQGALEKIDFKNIKYNESGPNYNGVAVAAMGTGPVDVNGCTFEQIGRIGVIYFGSGVAGSVYSNNTYTGKGPGDWLDYAVELGAGAVAEVKNNIITDCNGIASVDGSTSAGILVTTYYGPGTQTAISNNTLTRNSSGIAVGYNDADTSVVTARCNSIAGNYGYGIEASGPSVSVDAGYNWWGDATGPSGEGGGSGDAVSAHVDFFPWLLSTDCNDVAAVVSDYVVDDDWAGLPDWTTVEVGGTDYYIGLNAFDTIQGAVDAATDGNSIRVLVGTYNENIDVNKRLEITGQGSGTDGTVVIQSAAGAGDPKIGVVQLNSSGLSNTQPLLLKDIRVEPHDMAGFSIGRFCEATGTSVSYIKLDNVQVIGNNTNPNTEQERGLYVDLTSTVSHLAVVNCAFDNLTYGWYLQKQVSADTSTVEYVTVTNTSFTHNNLKGIYAEKLSDATFKGCIVADNGFSDSGVPSYFLPWMCGVDLNLKAGTYQNITFIGCIVTDNALGGAQEGVGLTVKGRGTGTNPSPAYTAFPAYVDNVAVIGGTFAGNERGFRFGEPGKGNATPTNVTVTAANIYGNIQTYSGSDGSAYGGLVNMTSAEVHAEYNWWGDVSGPNDPCGVSETGGMNCYDVATVKNADGLGDAVTENADYCPWLIAPSSSSDDPQPAGDLNYDGCVDWRDFAIFASRWLEGCQ
ncbi:MAG TPA: right-handed parallel beta-helix repeat-containing protein [Sedimentisphaerales bacterium]|nr:right-handed parallel beta-helix repeat-containing protein [Sedimentisphaerales bacterium]